MGKRFIISSEQWRMEEGLKSTGCYLRYNSIMNHLCKKHRFVHNKMINTDVYPYRRAVNKEPLPEDTELIYLWLDTHSVDFSELYKLFKQVSKAKIIWLVGGDRRCWHWGKGVMARTNAFRLGMREFLDRVDVILDSMVYGWQTRPDYTTFCICWPEFANKHVFFPNSYVHEDVYNSLEYNLKPVMKCLLTGNPGGRYELRNYVVSLLANDAEMKKYFDVLRHYSFSKMDGKRVDDYLIPHRKKKERDYDQKIFSEYFRLKFIDGWRDKFGNTVRENYIKCLNNYFCSLGINGGRKVQVVLMKHVEIPATGCLLLSEKFYDLDIAGFKPGEHYVEIKAQYLVDSARNQYVKTDLSQKIIDVLQHPGRYEHIRKNGMEFTRKNHATSNRFKLLDKIIEGLLSGQTVFRNYPKVEVLGEK